MRSIILSIIAVFFASTAFANPFPPVNPIHNPYSYERWVDNSGEADTPGNYQDYLDDGLLSFNEWLDYTGAETSGDLIPDSQLPGAIQDYAAEIGFPTFNEWLGNTLPALVGRTDHSAYAAYQGIYDYLIVNGGIEPTRRSLLGFHTGQPVGGLE